MPGIYYAAVEDDPLTSGPGSRVYASERCGTIEGPDGVLRRIAFIGDEAYCPKCNSVGVISYGAAVNEKRRLVDLVNGGRRQAVGDDIVLCKCAEHPRIVATYGRRWIIHDRAEETRASVGAPSSSSPSESHDELEQYFELLDAETGAPVDGMTYKLSSDGQCVVYDAALSGGKTRAVSLKEHPNLTFVAWREGDLR